VIDPSIVNYPKVTVILRGYTYEQVRCVVKNMVGTRLGAVEVAMNTLGAPQIIQKIVQEFGKDVLVGAGTVISVDRANEAVQAVRGLPYLPSVLQRIFSVSAKLTVL
jgi:2-dehydro-3-deoxyphosphogluconate aldolase/(4S)-4-hydroxy-2-oxoglutarate aldolase